uniref:Acyltransferase 3 domain-containing protein n=1 Tax=Ditylenchus dipsaci TaxID=166011 RepID=A0A915EMV7_9BILA
MVASLFLISADLKGLKNHEYAKQINEYKFLMHTWSLSVEIQYYFVAPMLVFVLAKLKNRFTKWTFAACLVIALISGLFQALQNDTNISFIFFL